MGRQPNKLRNAAGLIGLFFLEMKTELLKLHIFVAVEDLKISFYCIYKSSVYFSAPPHFRLVPPHFVLPGDGIGALLPFPRLRLWVSFLKVVWTGLVERFSKFLKS